MSGDSPMDKAADSLDRLSARASEQGGMAEKLAEPLAEDAAFLRKMKPRLVAARLRGKPAPPVRVPSAPPRATTTTKRESRGNVVRLAAAGLLGGIALAKFVDWRSYVEPRH